MREDVPTYPVRLEGGWDHRTDVRSGRTFTIRIEDHGNRATFGELVIPAEVMLDLLSNTANYHAPVSTLSWLGVESAGLVLQTLSPVIEIGGYGQEHLDDAIVNTDLIVKALAAGWRIAEPSFNGHRVGAGRRTYALRLTRFVDPAERDIDPALLEAAGGNVYESDRERS